MYSVFAKLLNMSAAASILIAVVIPLRFLLRNIPKKYICILWALVALRLICPVSISSPASAFNYIGNTAESSGQVEYIHFDEQQEAPPANTLPAHPGASNVPAISSPARDLPIPVLYVIWAIGCAAMLMYEVFSYWRVRMQVGESILLDKGNYRRDIYICDLVASPFILGILKPRIYLPSTLDPMQRSSVIAHERAHIARLDHWWKPGGFLLLSVHWFNPLVWVAYDLLCRDIEMACDEKVIEKMTPSQKQAYSMALLTCSMPRKTISACPLAFGESGVKERVRGILNYRKPSFWIISISVFLCLVLAVVFLSNPVRTEDYIALKQSDANMASPRSYTYNFQMQTGKTVRGPIVFAELWQSGELMDSSYCTVPESVRELELTLTDEGNGDSLSGCRVQIQSKPEDFTWDISLPLPEGAVGLRDYSWQGTKDISLSADQEILLAASIYEYGSDGYFLFHFDNENYGKDGGSMRSLDCVVLVYALFPAKTVVSEQPALFTQKIYQFADELPSGYTLKPIWPYYAGLYQNDKLLGRISPVDLQETDGAPDIQKTLGFDADYPEKRSITGADPDWKVQYTDGKESGIHYLHRVDEIVYDLIISGTEPEKEIEETIVPKLRQFLTLHPDAFVNTYSYMLLTGDEEIASINILRKDNSGGTILYKDEPFSYKAFVWLEPLEGMHSIEGITITARNIKNQIVWKYTVPYELGTAARIENGDWVIRRDGPPEEQPEEPHSGENGLPADLAVFLNPAMVQYQDNTLIDKATAGEQVTLEQLLTSEQWVPQPIPKGVVGPGPIRRGLTLRMLNGDQLVISYDSDALCIYNINGNCIGRYTGSHTGEQMVDMLWHWAMDRLHTGNAYTTDAAMTQIAPEGKLSILLHPTTALNTDGMGAVTPKNQEEWIAAWNAVLRSDYTVSEDAHADTYYGVVLKYGNTALNVHKDSEGFSLREMGGTWSCYSAKDAKPLTDLLEPVLREYNYAPVTPAQLKDIQYAGLVLDGMQFAIVQGDPKLSQLESILTSGTPIGYMPACPFASLLTVGLPSGEIKTVSVATDSCGVYLSNGVCYQFSEDNAALYQLFGVAPPA